MYVLLHIKVYIHVLLGSNELSCLFVYAHCSRHIRVVLFMLVERGELRNAQGCSAGSYLMSRFEHPSCSKYVTYAGYDVERESVYVYMQVYVYILVYTCCYSSRCIWHSISYQTSFHVHH